MRSFAELRSSGMLWLINRVVFHPRGLALALHVDESGAVHGWKLLRSTDGPFVFTGEEDDVGFADATKTLMEALKQ